MVKDGSKNTTDRVNIKAEVETINGRVKVKVPFVMAVMADLSGASADRLPALEKREFVEVGQATFEKWMTDIRPAVNLEVADKIGGGGRRRVELEFQTMEDFTPAGVARNHEPLRKLLYARKKLSEMKTAALGRSERERALEEGFRSLLRTLGRGEGGAASE